MAEGNGDGAQAFVARLMSVAVVVVLEAVDVGEQHRHPLLLAHRLLPDALNVLVEHAPVLNAGEAVARHHFAQQAGFEKAHAAGLLVHVDHRGAEQIDGDDRQRIVAELAARQLQRGSRGKIDEHHDHIGGERVIEDEAAHEINENDRQHQAGKQDRHAAERGDELDGDHAKPSMVAAISASGG